MLGILGRTRRVCTAKTATPAATWVATYAGTRALTKAPETVSSPLARLVHDISCDGIGKRLSLMLHLSWPEFDIDIWPQLDPYLEIEAPSWKEIDEAVKLLGLDSKQKKIFSTYRLYMLKGIDCNDYQEITFKRIVKKI